jgi:uncharacterized membrane protein
MTEKKGIRQCKEDFVCAAVTTRLVQILPKIRCQETDSGDSNTLRALVFAAVNCEVCRSAIALY